MNPPSLCFAIGLKSCAKTQYGQRMTLSISVTTYRRSSIRGANKQSYEVPLLWTDFGSIYGTVRRNTVAVFSFAIAAVPRVQVPAFASVGLACDPVGGADWRNCSFLVSNGPAGFAVSGMRIRRQLQRLWA